MSTALIKGMHPATVSVICKANRHLHEHINSFLLTLSQCLIMHFSDQLLLVYLHMCMHFATLGVVQVLWPLPHPLQAAMR